MMVAARLQWLNRLALMRLNGQFRKESQTQWLNRLALVQLHRQSRKESQTVMMVAARLQWFRQVRRRHQQAQTHAHGRLQRLWNMHLWPLRHHGQVDAGVREAMLVESSASPGTEMVGKGLARFTRAR